MIDLQTRTDQEYLEIIHALEKEYRVVRVKDIAERRGVTRAGVSLELGQLMKKGLISHAQYGYVTLTRKGLLIATTLYKRHKTIKNFLVRFLGISDVIAESDACSMEHIISDPTLESLAIFLDFIEHCPKNWKDVSGFFSECSKYGPGIKKCSQCSQIMLK